MAAFAEPPLFLRTLLNKYNDEADLPQSRPRVTLTFAQSIDSRIAGANGKQLILSGKESMIMTHWMRTMHDAILIGIGTALNDNPQLNTRHLPHKDPDPVKNGHDKSYSLPRPVVLDSFLLLDPRCKLLANCQNGLGRRPWLLCSEPTDVHEREEWETRRLALEAAGARVFPVSSNSPEATHIEISSCLEVLRNQGVRSLMVEGGARVIKSFFTAEFSSEDKKGIVDTIIVTIAPTFVGDAGVGYEIGLEGANTRFIHSSTELFGKDTVFAMTRVTA